MTSFTIVYFLKYLFILQNKLQSNTIFLVVFKLLYNLSCSSFYAESNLFLFCQESCYFKTCQFKIFGINLKFLKFAWSL